ncbi:MAG: AAA family ATPase [Eubacteriales bacterium]|nr:AAA family ATPase [Eubacteriales bacterium]
MGFRIAVAGKGGSGKTTVATLVIRYLIRRGLGPVLAVDADPNANLGEALGVAPCADLMEILHQIIGPSQGSGGIDKVSYLDFRVREALMDADGSEEDLVAMGRPEGSGCYCYANAMLRGVMERLDKNYGYTVLDNEAGLEHLSRRTTDLVDLLIVVSDNSVRGVRSAGRVVRVAAELGLRIKRQCLLVCKAQNKLSAALREEIAATNLDYVRVLPYDALIAEHDASGKPLLHIPANAPVVRCFEPVMDQLLQQSTDLQKEGELPCPLSFTAKSFRAGSVR